MNGLLPEELIQFCIIFLAALAHASLQLSLGSLLLLYHASLGKHIPRKTRSLVTSFVVGIVFLTGLALTSVAFLIHNLTNSVLDTTAMTILVTIMFGVSILAWLLYYRIGKTTELWLPKSLASYINLRAKRTESNIESFGLGILIAIAELPFSAILLIVAGNSILTLQFGLQLLAVLIYLLVSIFPLMALRFTLKHGNTVVDVQRWRIKNKNFFRFLTGILFITLAIFIVAFRIVGTK